MVRSRRRGLALEVVLYALAALLLLGGLLRARLRPEPFVPGPRAPDVLRVVTWNVGAGLASGGLQDGHLEHVAATLASLDPDLVFLQEIGRGQGRRLAERLRATGAAWVSERASGVAVLAQRGTLEELRLPVDRAQAVVYTSPGRPPVVGAGVHARAFSAEARNEAIGGAASFLFDRSERVKLLVGDLNLDLDLDKRRDLFSDDEHLDVETYNFVAERLQDAGRGRGPTAEPDRRLDYVFVSPDVELRGAGPWKGVRAEGMDHDPLVADLVVPR